MASFQKILFKALDFLFNRAQNNHKFENIHVTKNIPTSVLSIVIVTRIRSG